MRSPDGGAGRDGGTDEGRWKKKRRERRRREKKDVKSWSIHQK